MKVASTWWVTTLQTVMTFPTPAAANSWPPLLKLQEVHFFKGNCVISSRSDLQHDQDRSAAVTKAEQFQQFLDETRERALHIQLIVSILLGQMVIYCKPNDSLSLLSTSILCMGPCCMQKLQHISMQFLTEHDA